MKLILIDTILKKTLFIKIVFFVLLFLFPNIAFAQSSNVLLFVDEGCPYCEQAKSYIQEKKLEEKIGIEYKMISESSENRDSFLEYAKNCKISNPSIPMVVIDSKCFVGYPDTVNMIEKRIAGEALPESTSEENDGQNSTLIFLISIPVILLALVGYGFSRRKGDTKSLKNIGVFFFTLVLFNLLTVAKAYAICPLCTIAVGAGLGFSRYFGIDDLITSVWIGGILMSFSLMLAEKLTKKFKFKWYISEIISIAAFYLMTFIPFHFLKVTGGELNHIWGVDKIILGSLVGSLLFYGAGKLHTYLMTKYGKVLFPFQKVVIPVLSLWLGTLIFYIILYI
ncbi:MAG: glutaredoxin domain-containing protein [Candidatus Dojkabacteria bacterium]